MLKQFFNSNLVFIRNIPLRRSRHKSRSTAGNSIGNPAFNIKPAVFLHIQNRSRSKVLSIAGKTEISILRNLSTWRRSRGNKILRRRRSDKHIQRRNSFIQRSLKSRANTINRKVNPVIDRVRNRINRVIARDKKKRKQNRRRHREIEFFHTKKIMLINNI